jgi:hypothetical protein
VPDTGSGNAPVVDMGAYEAGSTWLYVDWTAPGLDNGFSWDDAFRSVQSALALSIAGDEIRVSDGTYFPTSDANRSATFQLKSGVAVRGGYAGYGAPNPDFRGGIYSTVLSGDIGTANSNSDNSYHVVTGSGTNSTAILEGFIISGGNARVISKSCGRPRQP